MVGDSTPEKKPDAIAKSTTSPKKPEEGAPVAPVKDSPPQKESVTNVEAAPPQAPVATSAPTVATTTDATPKKSAKTTPKKAPVNEGAGLEVSAEKPDKESSPPVKRRGRRGGQGKSAPTTPIVGQETTATPGPAEVATEGKPTRSQIRRAARRNRAEGAAVGKPAPTSEEHPITDALNKLASVEAPAKKTRGAKKAIPTAEVGINENAQAADKDAAVNVPKPRSSRAANAVSPATPAVPSPVAVATPLSTPTTSLLAAHYDAIIARIDIEIAKALAASAAPDQTAPEKATRGRRRKPVTPATAGPADQQLQAARSFVEREKAQALKRWTTKTQPSLSAILTTL